jgi:predicted amidohydrolase
MKAFVIQMTSVPDVQNNIAFVEQCLTSYPNQHELRNSIVVLPECFALFGGRDKDNLGIAENIGSGPIQTQLARLAVKFELYLVAGSMPTTSENSAKFYASTLVFAPSGKLIADYQKIHLFDVEVSDSTGSYLESNSTEPGQNVVCFDTEFGKVGLAICYDLRFPGLFQALREQGVVAIVLPSAFTETTGQAHWQPLIQARAIENQVFMIASDQNGVHSNGRETHGHSMIVSPWGKVLCNAKRENGLFGSTLDIDELKKIRKKMPVAQHNHFVSTYN